MFKQLLDLADQSLVPALMTTEDDDEPFHQAELEAILATVNPSSKLHIIQRETSPVPAFVPIEELPTASVPFAR